MLRPAKPKTTEGTRPSGYVKPREPKAQDREDTRLAAKPIRRSPKGQGHQMGRSPRAKGEDRERQIDSTGVAKSRGRRGAVASKPREERMAERTHGQGTVRSVESSCNPLKDECT